MRLLCLAIVALTACAAPPTQSDLDSAIDYARALWGIDTAVSIRLDDSRSCVASVANASGTTGKEDTWAITDVVSTTFTTRFDDGRAPVERVSVARVININRACAWTPEYLRKVVTHEYGHALGLPHSEDCHSIMFSMVYLPSAERIYGKQSIMRKDRLEAEKLK
jgi:hypothetical protein